MKVHPQDPKDKGGKVPAASYIQIIPGMTNIAWSHGYCIAVHGSMSRDLDVVAIPWVEDANDPIDLVEGICSVLGCFYSEKPLFKPHGRVAYVLRFSRTWAYVDLSIMLKRPQPPKPVAPFYPM